MQRPHRNNLSNQNLQAEDLITHLGKTTHMRIKEMLKWVAQTKPRLPIQHLYHSPACLQPLQHLYHKILEIDMTHTHQYQRTSVTTASAHHPPPLLLLAPQPMSTLEVLSRLVRL